MKKLFVAHAIHPKLIFPSIQQQSCNTQPFITCIVAGHTQSGKTVWVKTLLENAQKTINPPTPMATILFRYDENDGWDKV